MINFEAPRNMNADLFLEACRWAESHGGKIRNGEIKLTDPGSKDGPFYIPVIMEVPDESAVFFRLKFGL